MNTFWVGVFQKVGDHEEIIHEFPISQETTKEVLKVINEVADCLRDKGYYLMQTYIKVHLKKED